MGMQALLEIFKISKVTEYSMNVSAVVLSAASSYSCSNVYMTTVFANLNREYGVLDWGWTKTNLPGRGCVEILIKKSLHSVANMVYHIVQNIITCLVCLFCRTYIELLQLWPKVCQSWTRSLFFLDAEVVDPEK